MPAVAPSFLLIAGPNGSGKSTISAALRSTLLASTRIVDPDAEPATSEMAKARSSIARVDLSFSVDESLVVETTLAGTRGLRLLQKARQRGYRRGLFYICTESVEINLERIKARVAAGGHDVPEADVRRRFFRSLANVCQAITEVDEFTIIDNTTERGPMVVAHGTLGRLIHRSEHAPIWASDIVERLSTPPAAIPPV